MSNIRNILKTPTTSGDVGIELEYEGKRLPEKGFDKFWARVADGSLRGESGEFILHKPIVLDKVDEALSILSECFLLNKTVINPTFRAGTHVHINVQDMTIAQLFNMITLYLLFENSLLKICENNRRGNHFCLRAVDAGQLIESLCDSVSMGSLKNLSSDHLRYAALNVTSLFKFGSLEFRSLESTTDWGKLKLWINTLYTLKSAAMRYPDPASLLTSASGEGFLAFTQQIFGNLFPQLSHLFSEKDLQESVWEIQSIVFSRDWQALNYNIFTPSDIFSSAP